MTDFPSLADALDSFVLRRLNDTCEEVSLQTIRHEARRIAPRGYKMVQSEDFTTFVFDDGSSVAYDNMAKGE